MQMDPSTLPSQADLNSLYGAWNPLSYMRGFQNQDLQDQFRQQAYDANANTVQKGVLENLASEATLPYAGDTAAANLAGKQIANQSAGLDLASKQDLYQNNQDYLHKKLAREMSDEELTNQSNHFLQQFQQEAAVNGREAAMQKYGGVLDTLTGALASKAADRVQTKQLADAQNATHVKTAEIGANATLGSAGIHAGATVNAAQIGADERRYAAELKQNIANSLLRQIDNLQTDEYTKLNLKREIAQQLVPAYGGNIDLEALQQGLLRRQGDRGNGGVNPGTPKPQVSDDDLINKYLNKK